MSFWCLEILKDQLTSSMTPPVDLLRWPATQPGSGCSTRWHHPVDPCWSGWLFDFFCYFSRTFHIFDSFFVPYFVIFIFSFPILLSTNISCFLWKLQKIEKRERSRTRILSFLFVFWVRIILTFVFLTFYFYALC